jgi:hypothetical protein
MSTRLLTSLGSSLPVTSLEFLIPGPVNGCEVLVEYDHARESVKLDNVSQSFAFEAIGSVILAYLSSVEHPLTYPEGVRVTIESHSDLLARLRVLEEAENAHQLRFDW